VKWRSHSPGTDSRLKGLLPAVLLVALAVMLVNGAAAQAVPRTYFRPAAIPPTNTAPPTVSQTSEGGGTLSASSGSWSGTPPFTYSYQWQRCNPGQVTSPGSGPGQLVSPEGIAVDAHGNAWVSDTYHGRLEVFSAAGNFLKTVGSEGSGPGHIGEPEGIAIDSRGDVWVADWSNNRVEEFNEKGEYLQEFGSEGSDNGDFNRPYGIAVDSKGHVWVGDVHNSRVEEFNENGEYLRQFGASGTPGHFEFHFPMGLAVSSNGNILVTDAPSNRLEEFNEIGKYVGVFGEEASVNGQTPYPGGVTVDSTGNVWVVDHGSDQIKEFNAGGERLRQFGSVGPGPGQLNGPDGLAVGPNGHVWVADAGSSRIDEFGEQGEVIAHEGCADLAGATGPTYATTAADLGSNVQAIVTASNSTGEGSATGSLSSVVGGGPEPPISESPPSISGATQNGQTLSTSAGIWAGTEPLSYAYQWQRCNSSGAECANVVGATSSTYALGNSDVGTAMRVIVTATNSAGSASATSVVTAIVAPLDPSVIIGLNDGSGWGPADAERFVALGIKSERLDAPGGNGSVAGAIKNSQRNGFTNDVVIVGNTPDAEPLANVNVSKWTTETLRQVEEAANNGVTLLEVGNEMYLKGPRCRGCYQQKEPAKYAEMFVSLSKAVESAGIGGVKLLFDSFGDYQEREKGPWSQVCCGGGWLATAVKAEPELRKRVAGFVMHPYGEAGSNQENNGGPVGLKVEREQAVSLGFENTEYYATEFGVQLNAPGPAGSSSPANQAEKIRAVYTELIGYGFVKGIWYYQTHDDSSGKWGLIEPQVSGSSPFVPRPSLAVVSSFALLSALE
jgi:sugar lactone lactonase YvrE